MNVYVIFEDFRKDQHVVIPIVRRMLAELGKPNANVRACVDPLIAGISEVMKWENVKLVLERYRGMVQVFLLIVDRDGVQGRRRSLDRIEELANAEIGDGKSLIGENAWQEIEVWAIAGQDNPPGVWKEIREEIHPKEVYFAPLVASRNLQKEPGGGRVTLGREAAANYQRVKARCPEDVGVLEDRLKDWFSKS